MKAHAVKPVLLAAALAALAAASAAAQTAELNAAYRTARAAASSPKPAAAPASCDDAKELETSFELQFAPANGGAKLRLRFQYAGCDWEPRNDYLPPYTQRSYEAQDGYGLTIVTNDGASASEVLLSKGKDWIGDLGSPDNAALVSGDPLTLDAADHEISNQKTGRAVLRDAAKPLYPQLKSCEAADWSRTGTSAPSRADGEPALGYAGPGPSLVLLTKTAAYYYHEDCDICAEVTKCELPSGALSSAVVAHSVDCADMKKLSTDAVYDACADGR
jgi:hypothetical protein